MREIEITLIEPLEGESVTLIGTDGEEYEFRRFGPDAWEMLIGSSWESFYICEPIEHAYQESIRKNT